MILVTGASGFLGSAVVRIARARGYDVRPMVRENSDLTLLKGIDKETFVYGDMTDAGSLQKATQGVDAVVHCAATVSTGAPDLEKSRKVNVEGTANLLAACSRNGVRRFINISSQSAHPENPSVYGQTKMEQDNEVRKADDIDWTILKPSIIYGPQAKGIFDKMVSFCKKMPVIPIIGSGREEMRPIHVDDVAAATLDCIENDQTIEQTYDLGGRDVLEMNEFIRTILDVLGRKAFLFHLPVPIALLIAKTASAVMDNPPLTPDNVTGIQTVKHVDISDAEHDFNFKPRGFEEGLRQMWREKTDLVPAADTLADADPVKVAIIGLGKIGLMHASMCHAAAGVEVAALVDRDKGLGSQTQSWGIEAPFFTSIEEAVEKVPELEAAVVATPQFTHKEISITCLEKGLHVLCEKPLAHHINDARAMVKAADEHPDRATAVAFMKGHYPMWREAARRLQSGWIGTPRRFRASVYLSQVMSPKKGWTFTKEQSGGGILINSGIHLVHFLYSCFGPAKSASALMRPMHSNVEDTLCALLRYKSGVFGSYDASWSVPGYPTEGTSVLVEGDEGTLEITDEYLRTHHLTGEGDAPKGWSQEHRSAFETAAFTASPDYGGEGWYNQIVDFAVAIRTGKQPRVGWREGLEAQAVVEAIYASAGKDGAPVEVDPEGGMAS
ncbi:MAG: NAD-dependent epimerase/dehydratase family protein [Candidatus Sumerlaeota bacterium]